MGDMDKDEDGSSVVPLGHYATLCMGYVDYKGGSQLFIKSL